MNDIRAEAQPGSARAQHALLLGSGVATTLGLILSAQAAACALTSAQTAIVTSLILRALRERRGWRGAQLVVAISWFMLFTVPCWLYAIDPSLLDRGDPARATLIINIGLYGYALGLMLLGSTGAPADGLAIVRPAEPRTGVLTAWWLLGFAALLALLLRHGNPLDYLGHLDQSASLNGGAFYLVALAFTMRYAVLVWAGARWSQGQALPRYVIGMAAVGIALIGLTGARLFVAVALADFLVLYALLRRPLRLRTVAPYLAAAGIVLVFGVGTVKRYQGYRSAHPQERVGFLQYATKTAPNELAAAYANNYVDSVRLVAIGDQLVPRRASYDYGRPLVELALKPLPRAIRPKIARQPLLEQTFAPDPDYGFALPLVLTAFLSAGILAVLLVSVAIGLLVAGLERMLAMENASVIWIVTVVVAIVSVPVMMRSGVPVGATLFIIDVVGIWIVAKSGLSSPLLADTRLWNR